jgi:hypothetical protein
MAFLFITTAIKDQGWKKDIFENWFHKKFVQKLCTPERKSVAPESSFPVRQCTFVCSKIWSCHKLLSHRMFTKKAVAVVFSQYNILSFVYLI